MDLGKAEIYIGPNLLPQGLKRFTIYKDGVPTGQLEGWRKAFPHIGRLFVPVRDMDRAVADSKRKGTPVYMAYQEIERRKM